MYTAHTVYKVAIAITMATAHAEPTASARNPPYIAPMNAMARKMIGREMGGEGATLRNGTPDPVLPSQSIPNPMLQIATMTPAAGAINTATSNPVAMPPKKQTANRHASSEA